jgi:hypothetical protein
MGIHFFAGCLLINKNMADHAAGFAKNGMGQNLTYVGQNLTYVKISKLLRQRCPINAENQNIHQKNQMVAGPNLPRTIM